MKANSVFNQRVDNATSIEGVVNPFATVYSNAFTCDNSWAGHLEWTGTLSGTITLWYTNRVDALNSATDAGWTQAPVGDFAGVSLGGAAGNNSHSGNKPFLAIRYKYVHSSGTGTLYGWVNQR